MNIEQETSLLSCKVPVWLKDAAKVVAQDSQTSVSAEIRQALLAHVCAKLGVDPRTGQRIED